MIMQNIRSFDTKTVGKRLFSVSLAILGSTVLALQGCSQPQEISPGRTNTTSEDVANPPAEDSSKLIGKEITIRNQVANVIDPNGFVLSTEGGNPILILNDTGTTFAPPTTGNIPVQVTGTVESFVVADIEKKYGLDLDPNLYTTYDRQPVVVAQSLALAPTPQNLADAPAGYFDKTIAVKGEVRKIATSETTPNSFALFEQGWVDDVGVLVVGIDRNLQGGPIQEGELVVVTGTARQPDANLLQKNLGWDANKTQEFLSRYQNRPVIVAESVFPSAVSTN